jgi:hypothetical protein
MKLSDLSLLLERQMDNRLRDLPDEERQALNDERQWMRDRLFVWVDRFIDIEVSMRRRGRQRRQREAEQPAEEAQA